MNRILVWKHKYGESYYDASTDEALEKSACKILNTLVKDGWIYDPGTLYVSWDDDVADLTDEDLEKMPDSLRATICEQRDRARRTRDRETAFYDKEVESWTHVNMLVRGETPSRDGHRITAWGVLQERDGYEYEDYSLHKVE